jgi:MraZ protein
MPKFYTGKFERVVDQSGRVLLPTEFREVGENSFLLVVWPLIGKPQYLAALPPATAQRLHTVVRDFPLSDDSGANLSRSLASACYATSVDNYGRLPIPEAAAREVGINDRLILVGGFTRFELWNPNRFAAVISHPDYVAQVKQKIEAHVI